MDLWLPQGRPQAADAGLVSFGLGEPAALEECESPPTSAEQLGREEMRISFLSTRAAASPGIPVMSGDVSGEWKTWLSEHMRSLECRSPSGVRVRYGAAVRLVVQFSSTDLELRSGLPAIAAAAELGRTSANVYLEVIGYPPGVPKECLLAWEPLTVANYADVLKKASDLRTHVFDDRANIRPERLGVVESAESIGEATAAAIGRLWGTGQLAEGRSCNYALGMLTRLTSSAAARESLAAVCREITDRDGCDATDPDPVSQVKAQQLLGNVRIRA